MPGRGGSSIARRRIFSGLSPAAPQPANERGRTGQRRLARPDFRPRPGEFHAEFHAMSLAAASFLLLFLAAALEAGGDALVRLGLHGGSPAARIGFLAAGAAVLFAYGLAVNLPAWNFGRLLGVYVTLFFLVAQ